MDPTQTAPSSGTPSTASSRAQTVPIIKRNNKNYFRRESAVRIVRAYFQGKLLETVDRIPFDLCPKNMDAQFRCCIYKERAIIRLRCLSALGFSIEEDDEFEPLSSYARKALERETPPNQVMTVIDVACKGCVKSRYMVTELCQSCLERPCQMNCAFGAVSFVNGKSHIDASRCKNCGRCMNSCPYGAILKLHVPCEEACPVGAIHKSAEGRAEIDFEKCTACGRCMRACPFGSITERSQLIDVARRLVEQKTQVVALIAPAIVGQFPHSLERICGALQQLGFTRVISVASGADRTTLCEAEEFIERVKEGERFMTTSCCPAYVETAKKHIPELLPFISSTPTPMGYSAQEAKKTYPNCTTVFIGPCVAKRAEGLRDPNVDYVLTFEELGSLFEGAQIDISQAPELTFEEPASAQGRGFPITGGVADAVKTIVETTVNIYPSLADVQVRPVLVDGLSPAGLKMLKVYATKACPGNLVEIMTCEGGCVGGAGALGNPKTATNEIKKLVAQSPRLMEMPDRLPQ